MKKLVLVAGAAALALGTAGIAGAAAAPCAVNYAHPASAKQIKASLVQAFVSCNNPGGHIPNATTETGTVPTCYPAETFHEANGSPALGWTWGAKGKGDITFKAGKNKVGGPLNTDPTASDLYISIKMAGIEDNTGPATGANGQVATVARATLIDRAQHALGPMTVIDFPTTFGITATGGKVSKKTSATVILNALSQPALPACTTIEVVKVLVLDPNNNAFANLGAFLP
ncbi:MAG: hypothetical protein B6D46_02860 [Polyangiaceae bacterium UTPRO1]|jgi:hypothetical protein|nr:hypothetical protein [Myxococcales bacterium]OQY68601.1 MAG: hypothetical protein B6D46_02860 [Polyangiaceae bacterium UTPRO1]